MLNVVALGGSVIGEFYFHHIFSKFSVINMILLYTEKQIYKKKNWWQHPRDWISFSLKELIRLDIAGGMIWDILAQFN